MVLGEVLERLGDETFAAGTLVALEDLNLMVRVEAAGRPFGEGIGEYAAGPRAALHSSLPTTTGSPS